MRAFSSALAVAAVLALPAGPAGAQQSRGPEIVQGRPEVVAGDILRFARGGRVRLVGIEAPLPGQTCISGFGRPYDCHRAALEFLRNAVRDKDVTCRILGLNVERDKIGLCAADGRNLSVGMVRAGWAYAWRTLGHDYSRYEALAQTSQSGVWIGPNEAPWRWRSRQIGIRE
ncbi:MAG: thermonuclease family protein [Rhodospirillales bacterium]